MKHEIKTKLLGKLKIYIEPAHKVKDGKSSLFRKIFPKSASAHIISEARKDGIINASVYQTHSGFSSSGKIEKFHLENDNSQLAVCIELIDSKEKLQAFFLKHRILLKSKVVIYKEVEIWESE